MAAGEKAAAGATRWGFLGAGQMATAMIRGMLRSGTATPAQITASDPSEATRAALGATGVAVTGSNGEVIGRSDVVVLAVKPQVLPGVLADVRGAIGPDHLVVSIAAGVTLATLAARLEGDRRVVRVMPNTPSLVGEGASAYCLGASATADDETTVRACLTSIGRAYRVPEDLMDAVTGLSGSGPAFVYLVIEALADGGVNAGLPRDTATALAAQTVLGAAKMVLETGDHPGLLKDRVTSPGGTTIAGVHALERGGLRAALMDAVQAAARRSAELAQKSSAHSSPPDRS